LARAGLAVRALHRGPRQESDSPSIEFENCGDIAAVARWQPILDGIDTVLHLAGRAHVLHEHGNDAEELYLRDNFTATLALARGAIEYGVRRFVFLSSIKVYGDGPFSQPLAATREPAPSDPYGCSKWRAEQALTSLAAESAMDFMVSLTVLSESTAGTWHVADREVVSTAELIRILAAHMQRPARLFSFLPALLRWGLTLAGRSREYTRLCGSLVVDTQATRDQLHWHPPHSLEDGIARTVAWFNGTRREAGP
jgi:UDP-glucose 4-epimerase